MQRRDLARLIGLGAALGAVAHAADALPGDPRSPRRQRARALFRGFENSLRPSFSPDFNDLDEAGIRHDVRQSIAHGVFSVFCAPGELSLEETEQFFGIVASEAKGKVAVSTIAIGQDAAAQLRLLRLAEQAGFTHILVHPYPTFRANSEDDLYRYYRTLIDATGLDVVLWATNGVQMQNLHPSNVVVPVLDRLADIDNVVALKLMMTLESAVTFACLERLGSRLLVNCVDLSMMPLLVARYGVQWSGAWTIEALQSVDKPYVVRYLDLLARGDYDEALELYWNIKPAYDVLTRLMAPLLPKGVHPSVHLKYYQWCVGGNGGMPRTPRDPAERAYPLTAAQRQSIQAAYRVIGIEPVGPEASFVVGRSNYARGVRASDLPSMPMYAA